MKRLVTALVAAGLLAVTVPPPAAAATGGPAAVDTAAPASASTLPPALASVGFEQRLGAALPLELGFVDEAGEAVTLGRYFGSRPVLLVPAYYDCPMLCTLVLNGLINGLENLPFNTGEELEVVVYSIDPRETPAMAAVEKAEVRARYEGASAGWHFLTGDEAAIARLSEAIGFSAAFQEDSGEYAHSAGIVVATPAGVISRYFFGIDYPARDLRLGVVEAADGRVGSLVDQVLLFCLRYDPTTGRYSALTLNVIRLGGVVTVAVLALFVTTLLRQERRPAVRAA